jgi:hypothetical protein
MCRHLCQGFQDGICLMTMECATSTCGSMKEQNLNTLLTQEAGDQPGTTRRNTSSSPRTMATSWLKTRTAQGPGHLRTKPKRYALTSWKTNKDYASSELKTGPRSAPKKLCWISQMPMWSPRSRVSGMWSQLVIAGLATMVFSIKCPSIAGIILIISLISGSSARGRPLGSMRLKVRLLNVTMMT